MLLIAGPENNTADRLGPVNAKSEKRTKLKTLTETSVATEVSTPVADIDTTPGLSIVSVTLATPLAVIALIAGLTILDAAVTVPLAVIETVPEWIVPVERSSTSQLKTRGRSPVSSPL
jgi:hypothetical protein